MQASSDAQLLREYATQCSESAFTKIVARHTNLVYSAALRQTDSPELAADVAQRVFIGLAQSAPALSLRLAADASLAGWLCRSARNLSLNLRRDEFRRHVRERLAMEDHDSSTEIEPDWDALQPVLDDAMSELDDTDYDAIVLRFFQKQDLRSIGRALGLTDDAAQKRVSRALEKLREKLIGRGVTASAATISAAIAVNAVTAAPAGLAATLSSAGLVGTAAGTTAAVSKTIAMTTLQKLMFTSAIIVISGAGIYLTRQASDLRERNRQVRTQSEQLLQSQTDKEDAARRLAELSEENQRLKNNSTELLTLRNEVTQLRQAAAAASARAWSNHTYQMYGVPPGQAPPIISSSVSEMAWHYAQLRRKALSGETLTPAEEVHLAKALPYVKQLDEPDQFALFQANYLATLSGAEDPNTVWQMRQILERSRQYEHAKGLDGARLASAEDLKNLPAEKLPFAQRAFDQWHELDSKARRDISALLSPEQQQFLDAHFTNVLNFDPALMSDPAKAQNDPKYSGLTREQILEAWPRKAGSWTVLGRVEP